MPSPQSDTLKHVNNDKLWEVAAIKSVQTGNDKTAVAANQKHCAARSFVSSLQRHKVMCEVCTGIEYACTQVCCVTWKETNIHRLKFITIGWEGLQQYNPFKVENNAIRSRDDSMLSGTIRVKFSVRNFSQLQFFPLRNSNTECTKH